MLGRNTSTPEGARFWAAVEKSAREVERMPSWASTGVSLTRANDEDDLRKPCTCCGGTGIARTDLQTDCCHCGGAGVVW